MIKRNRVAKRAAAGVVALAISALFHAGSVAAAEYSLVIEFDDDNCPEAVDDAGKSCGDDAMKDKACAKRNDKLVWTTRPAGKDFRLYFDPLKGGPKHESKDGKYSRHIEDKRGDEKIPAGVEYKYTVVGNECPHKPHDPRIVIRPD